MNDTVFYTRQLGNTLIVPFTVEAIAAIALVYIDSMETHPNP